ncbi:probable serine/threonine-protein kinase samkA [Chenopodium quinoa]|uniref:probable serine/threonine-protein kinase samkA n=1 Tax=Chenopodium quinoa TaxID=63459 RepID=UPI000B79ABB7|nr:probable serine/threonine-protein kinase samkA [Chenopodium quinoa]
MGNCQAIDAATLVIQHPSGKVDKLYWSVSASEIMKLNPGHYVALLITTTICHTNNSNTNNQKTSSNGNNSQKNNSNSRSSGDNSQKNSSSKGSNNKNSSTSTETVDGRNTVRITRVKLLRPTDTLALGHVYRLISTQEVMKGLVAKKQAKLKKSGIELADSEGLKEAEKFAKRSQPEKTNQVSSRHVNRSRTTSASNGGTVRPKNWQPSLHSISEATS